MRDDAAPPGAGERAELVTKLAHEIRGPVTTLRGLAATAIAHYDGLSDDERREFLGLIRTEAERLEAAVEQVALAMRLDAGSLERRPGRHDLAELVRTVVHRTDVGDHPVDLDASASLEATFDPIHVTAVVGQLLRNAATFSPTGAPIGVSLRREGTDAVVEVRDRGPGIPPERRDEVFERFTAWRPPGYEAAPGTGLGLFVARELVRRQGGAISIVDAPGGGTMLVVRFPAGVADDDAADL